MGPGDSRLDTEIEGPGNRLIQHQCKSLGFQC